MDCGVISRPNCASAFGKAPISIANDDRRQNNIAMDDILWQAFNNSTRMTSLRDIWSPSSGTTGNQVQQPVHPYQHLMQPEKLVRDLLPTSTNAVEPPASISSFFTAGRRCSDVIAAPSLANVVRRTSSQPLQPKLNLAMSTMVIDGDQVIEGGAAAASPSSIQQPPNPKYKTEMCRSVFAKVQCKYGENCQFAHTDDEMRNRPHNQKYKTIECKNFHQHGYCYYGPKCDFRHNEPLPPSFTAVRPGSGASSVSLVGSDTQVHAPVAAAVARRSLNGSLNVQGFTGGAVPSRCSEPFLFGAMSDGESPAPSDCGGGGSVAFGDWPPTSSVSGANSSSRCSPAQTRSDSSFWSPPPAIDLSATLGESPMTSSTPGRSGGGGNAKQPIYYQFGGDGVYHVIYV